MKNLRVLALADLHICLQGPRREECTRILDWIACNARETSPDAIVIAGDLFDRRSTPAERLYFAAWLQAMADVAPVYAIRGNHDDPDDLRLFQKEYGFLTRAEIFLESAIVQGPGALRLAVLPWPELGRLSAKAGAEESIASKRALARSALIDVTRGFGTSAYVKSGGPTLLVVHMPITGASFDSGQPVASGEEIALSAEELLESGCAGVLAGHIHLRQQMKTADVRPVMYAGAPFRGSFGEAVGTKGGLLWDWNGKAWEVAPWEVPARKMVLIERAFVSSAERDLDSSCETPEEPLLAAEDEVRDADVRVRISFQAEYREAMREAMAEPLEALKAVAHSVVVEERASIVSRTRCAEISTARTTMDKLQAWAQTVGSEVPAGAAGKLHALEAEVRP